MPRAFFFLLATAIWLPAAETQLQGRPIHYTVKGAGPNTLLFIHGWSCNETFFAPQVDDFSAQYRTITIDLPGHGKSGTYTPLTMDLFADAVEAVRKAVKSDKLVLVGHSMGAAVARQYLRRYPGHATALVFLDGSIFQLPPDDAGKTRWSQMITGLAERFSPNQPKEVRERNVSAFLANLYPDSTPREFRMMILRQVLETKPETIEGAMRSMADLNLWREDKFDLPLLALRAGKQPPPGEDIYLKQLFPRVEYKFLPETSHFLQLEKPKEVDALLRAFLGKIKP
jgi:pimeloyl-ACP methyl ester carboxylesterase